PHTSPWQWRQVAICLHRRPLFFGETIDSLSVTRLGDGRTTQGSISIEHTLSFSESAIEFKGQVTAASNVKHLQRRRTIPLAPRPTRLLTGWPRYPRSTWSWH